MASRVQLVKEILKNLGVWQAGQDLPPEDYQAVNENLPYALLAMSKAGVFTCDPEVIPDDALLPLAAYLAQNYILTFGLTGDDRDMIISAAGGAEQALRFHKVMDATYTPIQIQSF